MSGVEIGLGMGVLIGVAATGIIVSIGSTIYHITKDWEIKKKPNSKKSNYPI